MKWRSQVLPLWKNPAANGPWYQVESNPVIPVPNLSFTPPAQCTSATNAISAATQVTTDPHETAPRRSGGLGAQIHTPAATNPSSTKYGPGSHTPKLPSAS